MYASHVRERGLRLVVASTLYAHGSARVDMYMSIATTLYTHGMCARGEEWSASEIIFGFIRPLNVDN